MTQHATTNQIFCVASVRMLLFALALLLFPKMGWGQVVSSINPTSGPIGARVVITGSNLSGATDVKFNSKSAASFTVDSPSQITAVVATGTTTGTMEVITAGGPAPGPFFIVIPWAVVTTYAPVSGPVGTLVTITGTDLNLITAVTVGGQSAGVTVDPSNTQLTFTVPGGIATGATSIVGPFGVFLGAFEVTAPLPVELLSFEAERQEETVRVTWATATEKNNAYFEVQRSTTGKEFSTIATVEGAGITAQLQTYILLDRQPLPGTSYYRLRQVDLDGTSAFSPVAVVAPTKELSLYPNPTHDQLHVQSSGGATQYRVLNLTGQVVLKAQGLGTSAVLDVASLPAGLYQLEVVSVAGRQVRKFMKTN